MLRGGPMHTAWSAKRTCRPWASASEYTATVLTPSSLQAQMTRRAISPRLAIRIFLNIPGAAASPRTLAVGPDAEESVPVLDGLPALAMDLHDFPGHLGLDLVHELHGFDDAEDLADAHAVAHVDEGRRVGIGRAVEGAHDRALHHRHPRFRFRRRSGRGRTHRGRRRGWRRRRHHGPSQRRKDGG